MSILMKFWLPRGKNTPTYTGMSRWCTSMPISLIRIIKVTVTKA